jgi:hypothetical protein
MFPTTSSVDEQVSEAATRLEDADPTLRVIAGRVFRLPYARLRARAAVQNSRRFNILEEFVLRAAAELAPPPAPAELAALLGLDPLFIEATLAQLEALKAVGRGRGGVVALTALGLKFFKDGQALQPAEHKVLNLVYRAGLDDLQLWSPPPAAPAEAPVLPGLADDAREKLAAQAQAAVTPARVIDAASAGGLGLHEPAEGRLVTGVDQVAVDDLGFFGCGVLVGQSGLTGEGRLIAIDPYSQAQEAGLQRQLDEWLRDKRVSLADFLPPQAELEMDVGTPLEGAAVAPEYQKQYQAQLGTGTTQAGVELLRTGNQRERAREILHGVRHTLLLCRPRLTQVTAGATLLADLETLARRGVISVIGWGSAADREHEPAAPEPGVIEALEGLRTPDGLPAALVWWVGSLYGHDALADHALLVSTLPNTLVSQGGRLPAGAATYAVTDPELVGAALEEVEPSLARAARQAWQTASRTPEPSRQTLVRCCQTWVAVRRPGEALSHVLKLAATPADEAPAAMLVAWELFTTICLSLARIPAAELDDMGAPQAVRRAIPEFMDRADSALPPALQTQPPFVAAFHDLLVRNSQLDEHGLPQLLAETGKVWAEVALASGTRSTGAVFSRAVESAAKLDKPKKRRY